MGLTTTALPRGSAGMANARRVIGGMLLLAQCLCCRAGDVLISSTGREPTITPGVPIDVLGNGSIVVSIAEAEWAWLNHPWFFSTLASFLVSLTGVFPLLLIPSGFDGESSKIGHGSGSSLRVMLSFAVGGLLGDVFLHLLPEAWAHTPSSSPHSGEHIWTGVWVLAGMLLFILVEKVCSCAKDDGPQSIEEPIKNSRKHEEELSKTLNNIHDANGNTGMSIYSKGKSPEIVNHSKENIQVIPKKLVTGYLNLVANSIDNFMHGLSVGWAFSLSIRGGLFTTFAILVHEVPHEIGDFAILLRSGFSKRDAARAQLLTGCVGVLGALVSSAGLAAPGEVGVSRVLPFAAGGFLHISLVSVLPEIVSESDPRESAKQLIGLAAGILLLAALTVLLES